MQITLHEHDSSTLRRSPLNDHLADDDAPFENQVPSSTSSSRKARRNKTEKAIEQCQEAIDRNTEAVKEHGQRRDEIQLAILEEQKRIVTLQTEHLANCRVYQEEMIELRKQKLQEIKEIKNVLIEIKNHKSYHCFILNLFYILVISHLT